MLVSYSPRNFCIKGHVGDLGIIVIEEFTVTEVLGLCPDNGTLLYIMFDRAKLPALVPLEVFSDPNTALAAAETAAGKRAVVVSEILGTVRESVLARL